MVDTTACPIWTPDECEGTEHCPPRCPRHVAPDGTPYTVYPDGPRPSSATDDGRALSPGDTFTLRATVDGELVERHGCPVRSIYADGGRLSLTFYAENLQTVRQAVADLEAVSDGVHLERLYRADDESSRDFVYIDRELFTERQREVLQTAHEMGYFAHPKEANAGEVAASLGIATTTFVEHLSTAQAKLLDRLLDE